MLLVATRKRWPGGPARLGVCVWKEVLLGDMWSQRDELNPGSFKRGNVSLALVASAWTSVWSRSGLRLRWTGSLEEDSVFWVDRSSFSLGSAGDHVWIYRAGRSRGSGQVWRTERLTGARDAEDQAEVPLTCRRLALAHVPGSEGQRRRERHSHSCRPVKPPVEVMTKATAGTAGRPPPRGQTGLPLQPSHPAPRCGQPPTVPRTPLGFALGSAALGALHSWAPFFWQSHGCCFKNQSLLC